MNPWTILCYQLKVNLPLQKVYNLGKMRDYKDIVSKPGVMWIHFITYVETDFGPIILFFKMNMSRTGITQ